MSTMCDYLFAIKSSIFCVLLGLLLFDVCYAQSKDASVLISQHKDWGAYRKGEICFVISEPEDSRPKNVRRGSTFLFVIHRPLQSIFDEVSITAGYPYRKGSSTTVNTGDSKFRFFTIDGNAWLDTSKEEQRIIKAMKKGAKMTVRGISSRGTKTTDIYSLKGFTAAMNIIDKTCKKNV